MGLFRTGFQTNLNQWQTSFAIQIAQFTRRVAMLCTSPWGDGDATGRKSLTTFVGHGDQTRSADGTPPGLFATVRIRRWCRPNSSTLHEASAAAMKPDKDHERAVRALQETLTIVEDSDESEAAQAD